MILKQGSLQASPTIISVEKYGFFLCQQGTAKILLGHRIYRIYPSDLCFYVPNMLTQVLEVSSDLKGIIAEADADLYYPILNRIDIRERIKARNYPCIHLAYRQAQEIEQFYNIAHAQEQDLISSLQSSNTPRSLGRLARNESLRHIYYALCYKALEIFFSQNNEQDYPIQTEVSIMNKFIISVFEHCHKERSVQYYAEEQNLSPYYFSTLIKEKSGKSVLQWICHITISVATDYLKHSELSIKEIAKELNFPDQSTFGRYFKQHLNCSPTTYRKNYKANNNK